MKLRLHILFYALLCQLLCNTYLTTHTSDDSDTLSSDDVATQNLEDQTMDAPVDQPLPADPDSQFGADPFDELVASNQSAQDEQPAQADVSIAIDIPIIGQIQLYPCFGEESKQCDFKTYIPRKGASLHFGPMTISDGTFSTLGDNFSLSAKGDFLGIQGVVSYKTGSVEKSVKCEVPAEEKADWAKGKKTPLPKENQAKCKKTFDTVTFGFLPLVNGKNPTLEFIPGMNVELTNIELFLDKSNKQQPMQITAKTSILGQNVNVTFAIGKLVTHAWVELANVPLSSIIPEVKNTPLENATLTSFKIMIKNLFTNPDPTKKTQPKPRILILDGKINLGDLGSTDLSDINKKQFSMRATLNPKTGPYFKAEIDNMTIPDIGQIKKAQLVFDFRTEKQAQKKSSTTAAKAAAKTQASKNAAKNKTATDPKTKAADQEKDKKKKEKNNIVLEGEGTITAFHDMTGDLDVSMSIGLNKKGIELSASVKDDPTFDSSGSNIKITNATIRYDSSTKTFVLSGDCDIEGHHATMAITYKGAAKKGGDSGLSASATLVDKTPIKPFSSIPGMQDLPVIKDISIANPSFSFTRSSNKKGTAYELAVQGDVTIFGMTLTGSLHEKKDKKTTTTLLDIELQKDHLPWRVSKGISALKGTPFDDLEFSQLTFIVSSGDYEDTDNNVTYKQGINFVGDATLTGPLSAVADFTGTKGGIQVFGHIAEPDPIHSNFTAKMSDGMKLTSNVAFGPFELEIAGPNPPTQPDPTFSLLANLYIKPSPQDDQLTLTARLKFNPGIPPTIDAAATMAGTWHNPLGISGLDIANVAAEIDLAPESPEPITSLGLAGSFALGSKCVSAAIKVGTDDMLAGSLNVLTLKDCVDYYLDMMGKSPAAMVLNAASKGSSKKIPDVGTLINIVKEGADLLPLDAFKIQDINVYIVPKATSIGEIQFNQGLTLRGDIALPGFEAYGNVNVSSQGFTLDAYCTPVNIDHVLEISKADAETAEDQGMRKNALTCAPPITPDNHLPSRCATPTDAKTQAACNAARYEKFKNGPLMHVALTADQQELLISGKLKLVDIFEEQTYIKINRSGMEFDFITALGSTMYTDSSGKKVPLLESHINGKSSVVGNAPQFALIVEFINNLQDYIKQQVHAGIQEAKEKVTQGIESAKGTISSGASSAEHTIAGGHGTISSGIGTAKDQSNKALQNAEDAVNSLQHRIDELKSSISDHERGCFG